MNRSLQETDIPEWMTKERPLCPGRPPERNLIKQWLIYNIPTDDMENTYGTNKGGDLLFAWETEKMPQRSRGTGFLLYIDQRAKNKTNKSGYGMDWPQKCIRYGLLKLDNTLSRNVQDEVIKLIEKTEEKLWMELITGWKTLAEKEIQRGIFQYDALLTLLFVLAMIPLIHLLRKYTGGYQIIKSHKKIKHLMNMDNIKLFAKN